MSSIEWPRLDQQSGHQWPAVLEVESSVVIHWSSDQLINWFRGDSHSQNRQSKWALLSIASISGLNGLNLVDESRGSSQSHHWFDWSDEWSERAMGAMGALPRPRRPTRHTRRARNKGQALPELARWPWWSNRIRRTNPIKTHSYVSLKTNSYTNDSEWERTRLTCAQTGRALITAKTLHTIR